MTLPKKKALMAWVGLWAVVLSYGWIRMSAVDNAPVEKELSMGLVQANITPQEKKRSCPRIDL